MNLPPEVAERRERISAIDRELVRLVARRLAVAREIGRLKREQGGAPLDAAQEAAVVRRAAELARSLDVPEEPVREIFWTVLGLCRDAQLGDAS